MKTLTPRNGLVLVRIPEEKEARTKSGIILPAVMGTTFAMAEIVSIGRGILDVGGHYGTDDLKPGMLVLIKSGQQMAIGERVQTMITLEKTGGKDSDKTFLLNQHDILAIVSGSDDVKETRVLVD